MAKKIGKRIKGKTFLPDSLDVVKAIAMQGFTDPELAMMFGLSPEIVAGWRKMYPSFDKALEEGRTIADLQVIQALHKKAVGFTYNTDVVVKYKDDYDIVTVERTVEPETNAIKYWLNNRAPSHWSDRTHHQVSGKKDEPAIGVRNETKQELMASILSLIQPKPDGV